MKMGAAIADLRPALYELLVLASAPEDTHLQIVNSLLSISEPCVLKRGDDYWIVLEPLNLKTRQLPPHPLLLKASGPDILVNDICNSPDVSANNKVVQLITTVSSNGHYFINAVEYGRLICITGIVPPEERIPWFVPLGGTKKVVRASTVSTITCNIAHIMPGQIIWQVSHSGTVYLYQKRGNGRWYDITINSPAWPQLTVYDEQIGNDFGSALQKLLLI